MGAHRALRACYARLMALPTRPPPPPPPPLLPLEDTVMRVRSAVRDLVAQGASTRAAVLERLPDVDTTLVDAVLADLVASGQVVWEPAGLRPPRKDGQ